MCLSVCVSVCVVCVLSSHHPNAPFQNAPGSDFAQLLASYQKGTSLLGLPSEFSHAHSTWGTLPSTCTHQSREWRGLGLTNMKTYSICEAMYVLAVLSRVNKKYAWGHAVIHPYIFYLLLVTFNGLNSICNSMLKCVRVVCYVPHAETFVMSWLAMLLCLQTLTLPSSHRWVSPSYGSIQAAGRRFFCVVEVSQGYSWLCVPMHHCRRLVLLPWEHLKLISKSLQLYVGWLCTSHLQYIMTVCEKKQEQKQWRNRIIISRCTDNYHLLKMGDKYKQSD